MSESNPIRVFATHCFDESDDYLRIFEFLESVDRFYYLNVSKPENLPTTGGPQELKDELIRQIKAFQHVRETDEATPSGWQPGKVTLKPGPKLVGKVWEVWKPEMAFE